MNDDKPIKYKIDFIKTKFESEGDLPLGKTFIMSDMITVGASALDKKVDVSDGNNTNKTSSSKECMLCHYWYFKNVGFKFEPHV